MAMNDKKWPRKRAVQFHFMASEDEARMIRERMRAIGISNMGAYLRKTAIDGYIVQMDLSDIKEFVSLLRRCSNNIKMLLGTLIQSPEGILHKKCANIYFYSFPRKILL